MGKKGNKSKKQGGRERFQKTQSPPKSVEAQENYDKNNIRSK